MTQRLPWGRILAEGLVILVSILLAFAVDAWWDAAQDRTEEEALLTSLLGEIQEASEELDASLEIHTWTMCNALRWSEVTRATPIDSIAEIVEGLRMHRTPSLSLSSVSAVLSSGQLSLVREGDLRAWISAWPGAREDFGEELEGIIEYARFVVPEYHVAAGVPAGTPTPLFPRESLRRLVDDPGFQALADQAFRLNEVLVREGRLVHTILSNGVSLIRAAIEDQPKSQGLDLTPYLGEFVPSAETIERYDLPLDRSLTIEADGDDLMLTNTIGSYPLTPGTESHFYLGALQTFSFHLREGRASGFSVSGACDPDNAPPSDWTIVP